MSDIATTAEDTYVSNPELREEILHYFRRRPLHSYSPHEVMVVTAEHVDSMYAHAEMALMAQDGILSCHRDTAFTLLT